MKKLLLTLALLTSGLIANAQAPAANQPGSVVDRATKHTETAEKVAGPLTENQKAKVQAINVQLVTALDANNRGLPGSTKESLASGKDAIIAKWTAEMSAILSAEQMQKVNAHVAEVRKNEGAK